MYIIYNTYTLYIYIHEYIYICIYINIYIYIYIQVAKIKNELTPSQKNFQVFGLAPLITVFHYSVYSVTKGAISKA